MEFPCEEKGGQQEDNVDNDEDAEKLVEKDAVDVAECGGNSCCRIQGAQGPYCEGINSHDKQEGNQTNRRPFFKANELEEVSPQLAIGGFEQGSFPCFQGKEIEKIEK